MNKAIIEVGKFLIFFGSGQLQIILILLEDMDNLEEDKICSKYSTELEWNLHFFAFIYSLAFWS